MNSEIKQFLRKSPYQREHILKYQPTTLLSESDFKNNTEVYQKKSCLNNVNYHSAQQFTIQYIEETCYFCSMKSNSNSSFSHCGDCGKTICSRCENRCGKCEKLLCQLDRSYDYTAQCICCFTYFSDKKDDYYFKSITQIQTYKLAKMMASCLQTDISASHDFDETSKREHLDQLPTCSSTNLDRQPQKMVKQKITVGPKGNFFLNDEQSQSKQNHSPESKISTSRKFSWIQRSLLNKKFINNSIKVQSAKPKKRNKIFSKYFQHKSQLEIQKNQKQNVSSKYFHKSKSEHRQVFNQFENKKSNNLVKKSKKIFSLKKVSLYQFPSIYLQDSNPQIEISQTEMDYFKNEDIKPCCFKRIDNLYIEQVKNQHIFQSMNGKTERSSLHKNPISSKLKHAQQTKRRNISSDFKLLIDKNKYYESRLPTQPKLQQQYFHNKGSRISKISNQQNQGRISFAACSLQISQPFSNQKQDKSDRYYDHQERQQIQPKLSYRSIQIKNYNQQCNDESQNIKHHNLFQDFEASRKKQRDLLNVISPKKQDKLIIKNLQIIDIKQQSYQNKQKLHFVLIILSLLLLFIQIYKY